MVPFLVLNLKKVWKGRFKLAELFDLKPGFRGQPMEDKIRHFVTENVYFAPC